MLENIYTTKMSANKKQLQNRFTKIRSKSSCITKTMSFVTAIFVAITMICTTVVLAAVVNEEQEQTKIEIRHGNTILQLDNKPFAYDNTIYFPLRELMEKIELATNENSYILWDDGKIEMLLVEKAASAENSEAEIKYLSYHYEIEIGEAEYSLNPGMDTIYQQKWNISNKKQLSHAPILKNGVTYIPFEFIEFLINRPMTTPDITYSVLD